MKNLDPNFVPARSVTRRTFFTQAGLGLGAFALEALLQREASGQNSTSNAQRSMLNPLAPRKPMLPGTAKSVIYLHMSGAPPTLDMFDYKPKLVELNMKPCPDSLLKGKRFAFIKGVPKMLGTPHKFHQHGKDGAWGVDLLPHTAEIVDARALVRSM